MSDLGAWLGEPLDTLSLYCPFTAGRSLSDRQPLRDGGMDRAGRRLAVVIVSPELRVDKREVSDRLAGAVLDGTPVAPAAAFRDGAAAGRLAIDASIIGAVRRDARGAGCESRAAI